MKPRNYNLKYAFIFGLAAAILYSLIMTGQIFFLMQNPPIGSAFQVMKNAAAEEIVKTELIKETTEISLAQAGDYRLISPQGKLFATYLSLHSQITQEEVPLTFASTRDIAPYNTDLLQGRLIFSFHIDKPGVYELHTHDLDLTQDEFPVTIFPDYTTQNRQRIVIYATTIFILMGVLWFILSRPVVSKQEKQVKRDKWDAFTDK